MRNIKVNDEGKVEEVEIFGFMLPLNRPKPQSEINSLLELATKFESHFDKRRIKIELISSENALTTIVSELTEYQKLYLQILLSTEGWMYNSDIREEFANRGHSDLMSQSIAGIRSGLSRKASKLEILHLDEREWTDKGENRYRIKRLYRERLSDLLMPE